MPITEGEQVRLVAEFSNDTTGEKADPSQPVEAQIRHVPTGNVDVVNMSRKSKGVFEAFYTPSEAGKYFWQSETSDDFKEDGSFIVESDRVKP